jgi:cytosine/uracil/thiamine/allantoin permease
LVVPGLRWLYDYAWFVGCFVSGTLYLVLMRGQGVRLAHQPATSSAVSQSASQR